MSDTICTIPELPSPKIIRAIVSMINDNNVQAFELLNAYPEASIENAKYPFVAVVANEGDEHIQGQFVWKVIVKVELHQDRKDAGRVFDYKTNVTWGEARKAELNNLIFGRVGGETLAARITKENPDLRIWFISDGAYETQASEDEITQTLSFTAVAASLRVDN